MSDKLKRRRFQSDGNKKHKQSSLQPGLKGFLCSCNFLEKDCVRESYNILNKYADKLYGGTPAKEAKPDEPGDIEDELQQEIEALRTENSNAKTRRFQVVESGAKNFLFIRTTLDNPVELAEAVLSDTYATKQRQTRFLIRLVPVEATCRAYVDDMKKAFQPLVDKYFGEGPRSFSIMYNHRNNNNLSKDAVIKELAEMVSQKRSDHTVSLKGAEVCVVVEVIKGIALLSVVPNYLKYKKFNLHAVCDEEAKAAVPHATSEVCESEASASDDLKEKEGDKSSEKEQGGNETSESTDK